MRDESGRDFSTRPASVDDLDSIAAVEAEVHIAPWTRDHFAAELGKPQSHILVLTDDESDGIVAGYVVFHVLDGVSEILNLAVARAFRGLGFARELVRRQLAVSTRLGATRVILDVRRSNDPALQLYQSLGFDIRQLRKRFYSNGEDAYHMELTPGADIFKLSE